MPLSFFPFHRLIFIPSLDDDDDDLPEEVNSVLA
jgi:hypothetical protein